MPDLLYVLAWKNGSAEPPVFKFFQSTQALEMSKLVLTFTSLGLQASVGVVDPPPLPEDFYDESMEPVQPRTQSKPKTQDPNADVMAKRRALKDRVAANRKQQQQQQAGPPPTPEGWLVCPSCLYPYDPQTDLLVPCTECHESKCSVRCVTNELKPCTDCLDFKAIAADADDERAEVVSRSAKPDAEAVALERGADQAALAAGTDYMVPPEALLAQVPNTGFNQHIFDNRPPEPPKRSDV